MYFIRSQMILLELLKTILHQFNIDIIETEVTKKIGEANHFVYHGSSHLYSLVMYAWLLYSTVNTFFLITVENVILN